MATRKEQFNLAGPESGKRFLEGTFVYLFSLEIQPDRRRQNMYTFRYRADQMQTQSLRS